MKTSSLIQVVSRIVVPCRQDRFPYQEGLERARRAVLLWFAGLGVFSCGMFRLYDLGIISSLKIHFVSTDPDVFLFL